MKVVLQVRDIQILKFVFACRAVTYDQIARRHFPNATDSIVRRRIILLVKAGYLRTSVIDLFGKITKVVQPQPKMWDVIKSKWPFDIDNPHFKSESLEHDVRLTELFLIFERLKSFHSFMTENLLCSSMALAKDPIYECASKLHSDGLLLMTDANGNHKKYALEIELSKKTKIRYRQKFIDYYLADDLHGVLYVTPDLEIAKLLANVDSEVCSRRESILYFAQEENLRSGFSEITFKNKKEQILKFK